MKVGDYVRTEDGYIFKVEELLEKGKYNDSENKIVQRFRIDGLYQKNEDYIETDYMYSDWVIKSSSNIIDLIEVGDYVNGSKVVGISIIGKDKEKWVWVEQMENTDNKYGDDYVGYNNDQIKSIVTKEQFKSMEYRLDI